MQYSRRHVLVAAGGGLALVGAAGLWKITRTPNTALLPWQLAKTPPQDVRLDAFRHAILAPNPHNRQPWLIRLVGADEALVSCDLNKRLPETDPFDRQTLIGFGTFFELARIAAAQRGTRMDIFPFPDGEPGERLDARPVARLKFVVDPKAGPDPLFAQIARRRSNKEPYDLARPVSARLAAALCGQDAQFTLDRAVIAKLRKLVDEALTIEQITPRTYMESVRLMRIGHQEIEANPDGIDLSGPMIETLKLAGLIDRQQLADPQSMAYKTGLESVRAAYTSIPAMLWVTTKGNSRLDQLEAGRHYVRVNLRAASLGLAMHPMSQSLQEYREVAVQYAKVHKLLGVAGDARLQMLARFGYGPETAAAPRWQVEKHILA